MPSQRRNAAKAVRTQGEDAAGRRGGYGGENQTAAAHCTDVLERSLETYQDCTSCRDIQQLRGTSCPTGPRGLTQLHLCFHCKARTLQHHKPCSDSQGNGMLTASCLLAQTHNVGQAKIMVALGIFSKKLNESKICSHFLKK